MVNSVKLSEIQQNLCPGILSWILGVNRCQQWTFYLHGFIYY